LHIPDGYLSPVTCATLYTGAAPFWWGALRRVRRGLHTQMVPLLSVFAAFSFIIMMFNLPLPGGTTGHAVGVGIAAIVLGPWASILAISVALMIQAIFFGDGGITAIGANCFNMGVIGSLVAYATYELISRDAPVESPRRVWAAGLAGYLAINFSALAAAIELGIQPQLYKDASGAPLYAPYPLSIAVPAMMIGHLTVAGLAELIVSAGVVAYLQKSQPNLLRGAAGGGTTKPLWAVLAILAILTPFGVLAEGSAWGEWSVDDLLHPETRQQIAAASGGRELPAQVPAGLERLARMWAKPMSYSSHIPAAITGMILIIGACWFIVLLARWIGVRRNASFVERTLASLMRASEYAASAEHGSESPGLFQKIDPRVKVAGLLLLIIAVAATRELRVIAGILGFALVMALLSRISLRKLAAWVWIPVLLFTGVIAAPAVLLTGPRSAVFLVGRAGTAATLAALLVLTTPWAWVLKSLRSLKCPATFVAILGMTYRYIFEIMRTALDMLEARRSRTVGALSPLESRRLAASTVGVLLSKSFQLSGDVHLAMQSRGFRGDVRVLPEFRACAADWCWLGLFVTLAGGALWWGL
jgi:cobalt/nickel transport system permease protein